MPGPPSQGYHYYRFPIYGKAILQSLTDNSMVIVLDTRAASENPESPVKRPETAEPELKAPSLYRVVLLNDDYTPMEFVVEVLEVFFNLDREMATQVMLAVHKRGKGVCGVFPKDIAETKAEQVNQAARDNDHPLLCEVEPLD